jgi:hypothetical protein
VICSFIAPVAGPVGVMPVRRAERARDRNLAADLLRAPVPASWPTGLLPSMFEPDDKGRRCFRAFRPGQLLAADFTYVPLTGGGLGYTSVLKIQRHRTLKITGWLSELSARSKHHAELAFLRTSTGNTAC